MDHLVRRYPTYVFCVFTNEVLLALPSYVGNVLFLKYLVQMLLDGEPLSGMLLLLGGTALFLVSSDCYTAWFSARYVACAEEHIRKDFYGHVRNAAARYGLEVYDNPDFYNDMTYINNHIAGDSLALLTLVSKMTAGLINVLLIVRLFYGMGGMVLLFSAAAVGISIAFDVPMVRTRNQRKYAVSGMERKRGYFRDCFFARETFAERKMTDVNPLLYSRYEESVEEQRLCEKRFGRRLFLLSSLKELLSTRLFMQFLLIAYLLYQVLAARTLQGSDFIAVYNAANVIVNAMLLLVRSWGQLEESSYTVGKYRGFLAAVRKADGDWSQGKLTALEYSGKQTATEVRGGTDSAGQQEESVPIHSIEFRRASFAYPGTGKHVLKEISFCMHSGEKIAIVGKNGSGKTTLVHLLMGLYVPTEGEILVNGRALAREELPSYRRQFAAFFQGMQPMEATVAENVALDTEIDPDRLILALRKTGCEALLSRTMGQVGCVGSDGAGSGSLGSAGNEQGGCSEPDSGLDTLMITRLKSQMIGIRFDPAGLILSGGECQKLMLAHCFYSDRPVLVMDEPSSALDPVLEQAFNRQLAELAEDKLAVFVTHRLSTVHMADLIYVIEDGRLCEQGSHGELIGKDGVYGEMWRIQREKYAEG